MDDDVIFISHANPQDDYFAAWLASKLQSLGYYVWVDLENLRAGESFNTVIEPVIREEATKFLAVTTKDYTKKAGDQYSGVARELNCATTVSDDSSFIIPLKVDDVNYNDFPYFYKGWKGINFYENWQKGLIELIEEFKNADITTSESCEDPIKTWFKSLEDKKEPIVKEESYYSNWFRLEIPDYVYIHKPKVFKKDNLFNLPYPFTMEANYLITFASLKHLPELISIEKSFREPIKSFYSNKKFKVFDDFVLKDPKRKLIHLLNNCFRNHLHENDLTYWRRGKYRRLYYFKHYKNGSNSINLKRYGKPRGRRVLTGEATRKIYGKKRKLNWHFGIDAKASLHPFPHFKVFYSIAFTNERFRRFDKDIQHKLRRDIPSNWYNRKWFETLLAAMLKISPTISREDILINIDKDEYIPVSNEPIGGVAEMGYEEPS